MNDFLKPTLILAVVALLAGTLLAGVYSVTYQQIEKLNADKEKNALSIVLPGYELSSVKQLDPNDATSKYWLGTKHKSGSQKRALAFISESSGYSGTISVMIGVDQDFTLLGISILNQTETPGLGARCQEIASKNTFWDVLSGNTVEEKDPAPWFEKQFRNLSLKKSINIVKKGDWTESIAESLNQNNQISAITGATITTRAVLAAVENGKKRFKSVIEVSDE